MFIFVCAEEAKNLEIFFCGAALAIVCGGGFDID